MELHGLERYVQRGGDLSIGMPLRREVGDAPLGGRERSDAQSRIVRCDRRSSRREHGARPPEHGPESLRKRESDHLARQRRRLDWSSELHQRLRKLDLRLDPVQPPLLGHLGDRVL